MAKVAHLKVLRGFVRDKDITLPSDRPFTIGRDSRRDLALMSRKVSRNHAQIEFKDGNYILTDLESKRGTIINRREVSDPTTLRHNDQIQIAEYTLAFVLEDDRAALRRASPPPRPAPVITAPKPVAADKTPSSLVITPSPVVKAPGESPSDMDLGKPVFTEEESARVGQIIGHVRLIAAIDKGRRTVVYKGIHDAKNRVVAFKMLHAQAERDPEVVQWFIRGAKRAGELRHEDSVSVLGGGKDQEAIFIYTRFMDGGSALQRFARASQEGLPAVKRALEALVHMARALEFAHGMGILHLGVRPSKILFDEQRFARLNGLGFDNSPSGPGLHTALDVDAYAAPEQLTGRGDITLSTDVFSLGATFYYMLTGRRPARDHRQRMPAPRSANPVIPDSICRIYERMVDPSPEKRYKSYGQLLHDVRWALRGEVWPHA